MSETIVPYRTRRSAAEFASLTNEIHRLIAEAVRQGIQPTEVWLGSRELEIFDAANTTTEANCYTSKVRTFANLAVKRSFENGVRVGATVASPTPGDC
jgi:hypothetical protein